MSAIARHRMTLAFGNKLRDAIGAGADQMTSTWTAALQARRIKRLKKERRCIRCARPLDQNTSTCSICTPKENVRKKRWRDKMLSEGRCPHCAIKHNDHTQMCESCNERQRQRVVEGYAHKHPERWAQIEERRKLRRERRKAAVKLYRGGMTQQEVGEQFGVSRAAIALWMKALGEPARRRGRRRTLQKGVDQ